jgi:ketose-bisphosphate aldolase
MMSIVGMDEILARARRGGYAVGYFEAWDQYSFEATLEAAEETRSPAIIGFGAVGVNQQWLNRWGILEQATLACDLAESASVPVAILFNEAASHEQIVQGLLHGCNAVMLDSSELPYEEHLAQTRAVADLAHAKGATVEAEVGRLADAREPDLEGSVTDPDQAAEFVARTGTDALAVSVGNVHQLLGAQSEIDLDLLDRIHQAVAVPLVIHGGSGFPDAAVPAAIERGVAKFNVGTVIRRAFLEGIREAAGSLPDDPIGHRYLGCRNADDVLSRGQARMKAEVLRLTAVYGSAGQASG